MASLMRTLFSLLIFMLILYVPGGDSWFQRRRRRNPCRPTNCKLDGWSKWNSCTHSCGTGGQQMRGRVVLVPASCGGHCNYHLQEKRPCNRDACKNGGTPALDHCRCPAGFEGTCCEIASPTTVAPTAPQTTAAQTAPPSTAAPTAPPSTAAPTDPPSTAAPTAPPSTAAPTALPSTAAPTASMSPACGGGYLPQVKCQRNYTKIGGFKEKGSSRTMPVLLLNDKDCFSSKNDGHKLDWSKFEESIHSLACRCAVIASQRGWDVFGLQNYGECWSGPSAEQNFKEYGKAGASDSVQSIGNPPPPCDQSNPQECIGKPGINYVYCLK